MATKKQLLKERNQTAKHLELIDQQLKELRTRQRRKVYESFIGKCYKRDLDKLIKHSSTKGEKEFYFVHSIDEQGNLCAFRFQYGSADLKCNGVFFDEEADDVTFPYGNEDNCPMEEIAKDELKKAWETYVSETLSTGTELIEKLFPVKKKKKGKK